MLLLFRLLLQILFERDFMLSPFDNNPADDVDAFNPTSRYLDDVLNIDNH